VRGTFTVYEKRPYYQPHNRMYKSIFFYRGYAVHGYPEIPTYPASAGCARTYNGDQDFLYPKVRIGDRVAVY
jgi:lipoprotein-anchoring transpeptidase ErfK/SrfK